MRRVILAVGLLAGLAASCAVGMVLGILWAEGQAKNRKFAEERDLIAPILASDPAFSRVEIHMYSGGGCYLTGKVESSGDLERLRAGVVRSVGETRADHLLIAVGVESQPGGSRNRND